MVNAPKARPDAERALLDALRSGPGTVRTLHARIGRFSQIALRQALHRLVKEGGVLSIDGPDAKIYRLERKLEAWIPAARPVRLTPARLAQLRLVGAAKDGMPEGSGWPRRMRTDLEAAGLVQLVARPRGRLPPAERRWHITDAGALALVNAKEESR